MPFDPQPTLEGDLVALRPLCPKDFDDLFAVAADPRIWEQHPDSDRYQEQQFRSLFPRSARLRRSAGCLGPEGRDPARPSVLVVEEGAEQRRIEIRADGAPISIPTFVVRGDGR